MAFGDNILKQLEKTFFHEKNIDENQKFLRFVINQILRDQVGAYALIINGITDGSDDNGIDAIYISADGKLIEDVADVDFEAVTKVEVFLIQITRGKSVKLRDIWAFKEGLNNIFNIGTELSGNEDFKINGHKVRDVINNWLTASKEVEVHISLFFITLSEESLQNTRVVEEMDKINSTVHENYPDFQCSFHLYDAKDLFNMSRFQPNKKILKSQTMMRHHSDISGAVSYYYIVNGNDFFEFLKDETKDEEEIIDDSIFEMNVRDYLGNKPVNKHIKKTIKSNDGRKNFLYMNNGITILAKKVRSVGSSKHTLHDYHIINGCQTSYTFWEEMKKDSSIGQDIEISIKVIETEDEKVAAEIIRATNSQTTIPNFNLRSLDRIHLLIEDKLKEENYFYERRANYYKRRRKPYDRIIDIKTLFQVLISVYGRNPRLAKGNLQLAYKSNYDEFFSQKNRMEYYLIAAKLYFSIAVPIQDYKLETDKWVYWNRKMELSIGKPTVNEVIIGFNPEIIQAILRVGSFYFVQAVFILLVFDVTGERIYNKKINMEEETAIISKKNYNKVINAIEEFEVYSKIAEDAAIILIDSVIEYTYPNIKRDTVMGILPDYPIRRPEISPALKNERFQKTLLEKIANCVDDRNKQ